MYFLSCFTSFFFEVVSLRLFSWLTALAICFWAGLVILQLVPRSRRVR